MCSGILIPYISIHSLVKRETSDKSASSSAPFHFNPLPRKEGDNTLFDCLFAGNLISIHSLVKRETQQQIIRQPPQNYFNPLPRKEGDFGKLLNVRYVCHFNPLPRKEGDIL